MDSYFQVIRRAIGIMLISIILAVKLTAQTATATGSGTWDPQTQSGTAIWSGGTGTGGSPAVGNSVTISSGITVALTGNGAGNYNYFDNQSGSPSGFDLNGFSIGFTGNISGGCIGTGGGKIIMAGSNQSLAGIYTLDSLIFGGSGSKVISVTTTLYGHTVINSGVSVIANGQTLNLYGNITNYGTTSNNSGSLTINMYGNLTNYGTWDAYYTYMRMPLVITGTGPFNNIMTIDTTCRITGKVTFEQLSVPADDSLLLPYVTDTLITTSPSTISGAVYGIGAAFYNGNTVSANTELSKIYFKGTSQSVSGTYTADSIIFSGSSTKTIVGTTTLYGNMHVNSGVTVSGNGTTLNTYGNITNYGITTYSSGGTTINAYGNLINYGTWNTYTTNVRVPALITGTGLYENDLMIDTTCRISGKVRVERLTVPAGDSLLLPDPTDTLVTSLPTVISGVVQGSGVAYYNGSITSAYTEVSDLQFAGISQTVSGTFTSPQVTFGGSSTKTIGSTTTFYGDVLISSGVTVSGNGTTLNIYGDITNYGITTHSSGGTTINAYGNMTNHGTWNTYTTIVRVPALITGTGMYENDLIIDTTCRISGKVRVQRLTVTAGDSLLLPETTDTLETILQSVISGVVYGSGTVYYNHNITSANTEVWDLYIAGVSQTVSGTFTSPQITFAGSSTKTIGNTTTLYGDVLINSGVTVSGNGTTLNIYGTITNYGITTYSSGGTTINAYGNLINYGTWNTYNTNVRVPALITGTGLYENDLMIDTTCRISGKVRVERLTVPAGDSLLLPDPTDTLVTSLPTVVSGEVYGVGVVYYNGNISSAKTTAAKILFSGSSFMVSGIFVADSIIFMGSGTKTFQNTTLLGDMLVSSGVTLLGNGTTLNVYGNIVNYGTTSFSSNPTTLNVYGNLTNMGTWNTYYTFVKIPSIITGTGLYENDLIIDTTCRISGKVRVERLTVTAGDSLLLSESADTLVTSLQTVIIGVVYGIGVVYYNNNITSANTDVSGLYFTGGSQSVNGTFTASQITFGGSATKTIANTTSLYGDVLINSGIIVSGNSTTLNVYGNIINYGVTTYNSGATTINAYGNLTNNGTWNTYYTNVKMPAVITGTGAFQNQMRIDTACRISGTVRIWNLTVSAGDSLIVNSLSDTLITTDQSTVSGMVWGNGIVYYNAAIGSSTTMVSQIYFAGSSQTFTGTYIADSIIFSGSGNKTFDGASLYGNAFINSGVTLIGNNDTLYVYGSMTNYGTTTYSSNPTTIRVTKHLFNYGTWNTYYTFLTDTGLTGGSFTNSSGYFYINADRSLSGNLSLAGNVTLNGMVRTGSDTFIVNTNNFTRTSGYIDGNLRMPVTTGAPVVQYHLGNVYGYTPVTVSFTGVTTAGKMTVSLMTGAHPAMAYPDSALTRYWKFSKDNLAFTSYSPTLRYLTEDFNTGITEPLDESSMIVGQTADPRWTFPEITTRTPGGSNDGGSLVVGNLTGTGDLVIANDTIAYNIKYPPVIVIPLRDTIFSEDLGNVFVADLNSIFEDPQNATIVYETAVLSGTAVNAYLLNDSLYINSVANEHGESLIKITAADAWNTVSDTFTVVVLPVNDAPVLMTIPDISFAEDSAATIYLNDYVTDVDHDTTQIDFMSTVIGVQMPVYKNKPLNVYKQAKVLRKKAFEESEIAIERSSGDDVIIEVDTTDLQVSIDTLTHAAVFSCTSDSSGIFTVIFTATDDSAASDTDTIMVSVTSVNDSPRIVLSIRDTAVAEDFGRALITRLSDRFGDIDNPELTYFVTIIDSGVTADVTGDSLFINSVHDFSGIARVIASASDGMYSVQDTFEVIVSPVNDPPLQTAALRDTMLSEDFEPLLYATLSGYFADIDNPSLTYTAVAIENGVIVNLSEDSLFLQSQLNFNGLVRIKINVTDTVFTVSDTFTVTVMSVNDAPAIVNLIEPVNNSTLEELTESIPFKWSKSNDADGDTLTYSLRIFGPGLDTTIFMVTDTAHTFSHPQRLRYSSSYRWNVNVTDGIALVACPDTFVFITPALTGDTVPAQLTVGSFFSTVLKRYLSVNVIASELLYALDGKIVIRSDAGNQIDSTKVTFGLISAENKFYQTPYKLASAGRLFLTITGTDSAQNITTVNKSYSVGSIAKDQALTMNADNDNWQINVPKLTVGEDGFLMVNELSHETTALNEKTMIAMAKASEGWTAVGDGLYIQGSAPIRSGQGFTITMRYDEDDISDLRLRYTDYDERKIGMYADGNGEWTYIGGEGRSGHVQAKMKEYGRVKLMYNPDHEFLPTKLELVQNFPNPFNPMTTIRFGIPQEGKVKLTIYNILGQKVRELVNDSRKAGYYTIAWNGRTGNGHGAASGVYLYRIEFSGISRTMKMTYLK